ncbi:unnamed protein product [Discosporangium mesarthrocarpum]
MSTPYPDANMPSKLHSANDPPTARPSGRPTKIAGKVNYSSTAHNIEDKGKGEKEVHRAKIEKLTRDREHTLNNWPDAKGLSFEDDEIALATFLRKDLKFLFGRTGFDPPVPARNPVSVSMHNPRFSAGLWALNTEAYQRKGYISRSLKEVVALGISLSNKCPHCAFIHTAFGSASGSDVTFEEMQSLYQTGDVLHAFETGKSDPLAPSLAAWALAHRDGEARHKEVPVPAEMVPEVMGTMMLFEMYNRIVDVFVSKEESGPMFPYPIRLMMRFKSLTPMVQRMMSTMMGWLMYAEDRKVEAGKVLRDINAVAPVVHSLGPNDREGGNGDSHSPQPLTDEFSWATRDPAVGPAVRFLAAQAELMSNEFVPATLKTYVVYWVSCWDGTMAPCSGWSEWVEPEVVKSMFNPKEDAEVVAMLRVLLVTVVASYEMDDDLLSECQAFHGIRATHAAVMWGAYLAAQRACVLVGGTG